MSVGPRAGSESGSPTKTTGFLTVLQKLEAFKKKQQEEKETGAIAESSTQDDIMVLKSLTKKPTGKSPIRTASMEPSATAIGVSSAELTKFTEIVLKKFDNMDQSFKLVIASLQKLQDEVSFLREERQV